MEHSIAGASRRDLAAGGLERSDLGRDGAQRDRLLQAPAVRRRRRREKLEAVGWETREPRRVRDRGAAGAR
jgi:hypothetical protein